MDTIEDKLSHLLNGVKIDEISEFCDFSSVENSNTASTSGISSSTFLKFIPKVKDTVTYIVMGVIFNSEEEILLMQESKNSCVGQWYLPAGRMEPNENIVDSVKREVLEETGLMMNPTTLVMVECYAGDWYRFVLMGTIIGGQIKTLDKSDKESLQAKWVKNIDGYKLRSNDIKNIIERGRSYYRNLDSQHKDILPALKTHSQLLLRPIICIQNKSSGSIHVLLSEKNEPHFPVCKINHLQNFKSNIQNFMVASFGANAPNYEIHGVLCLEHCSNTNVSAKDGLCITILVSFNVSLKKAILLDNSYKPTWFEVNKELGEHLLTLFAPNRTITLNI